MSETPETDAAEPRLGSDHGGWVRADFARKLERERDEWYHKAHVNVAFTFEARAERDEARDDLEFRRELFKVQEHYLEKARKKRDEAILRREETICAAELLAQEKLKAEQERDEALSRCADLAHQILLNKLSEARP